jgi:site-specific recombinase XerD
MASIQKFARLGHRIYWRLYLPDGTFREKYRASSSKSNLQEILPDVIKVESLSRRGELSGQDLIRALNMGIITRAEMDLFRPHVGPLEPHFLVELRPEFENLSKAQSTAHHTHMANLSKANVIEEYFRAVPMNEITPETIERFRVERKRAVTNTTVNHDLKVLRKYLDIAASKKLINDNPARKTTLLREPKGRIPRCFYPTELKTFFGGMKRFKHLLYGEMPFIVRTLVYTGLRRSELCNLKPENVKLHLRQIHLIGKGRKARIVGIHRTLVNEFKARMKKGYIVRPGIDPSSLSHAFKKIIRGLGLAEALTLHSLRHTYISYLLEMGAATKKVQEHAGHFSLTVTDHYTHALPSQIVIEDVLDFEGRKEHKKGKKEGK